MLRLIIYIIIIHLLPASSHAGSKIPPIEVNSPTVIAFFHPVTKAALNKDANLNEALSDFQYHLRKAKPRLKEFGITVHEIYSTSFKIRLPSSTTTFTAKDIHVGYYFILPGNKPMIRYGVLTDIDLLHFAEDYFGTSKLPEGTKQNTSITACQELQKYQSNSGNRGSIPADLKGESICIMADFDSNGFQDFVVWGHLEPGKQNSRGTRSFKVLYFDDTRILRTQTIKHDGYDHAAFWPRGKGSEGACKISPQQRDGIVLPGEGGGSWYYIYDPQAEAMVGRFACDE